MEMKDFVKKVTTKFESPVFDLAAQEAVDKNWLELLEIKNKLVETCVRLDQIKREIYYRDASEEPAWLDGDFVSKRDYRVIHASIGLATEAVEFLEGAFEGIDNNNLDEVHLIEEAGDAMFYMAMAADTLGSSFEQIAEANSGENGKLEIRYKKKFSKDKALGRDLVAERAALEAATKKPEPTPTPSNGSPLSKGNTATTTNIVNYTSGTLVHHDNNVITFPAPEQDVWEEDIKAKYLKFGASMIIVLLGFLAALIGPQFFSRLF